MRRRPLSNTDARNANHVAAVFTLVATAASGCSFLFSEGPPAHHRDLASFQCGASSAPPVLDTVAAGLAVYGAAVTAQNEDHTVAAADPSDRERVRRETNVVIGVFTAAALLDAASAVYGYRASSTCRAAEDLRRAEVARARLLPPPYGAPPYGVPPPLWPPPVTPASAPSR
ncbi:MAG TPA: hypothetical protein VHK47_16500 [Polyangia bacterium]|jgi:hypothetical protein|nr:hypothetical protein [Polyangia bacterium]